MSQIHTTVPALHARTGHPAHLHRHAQPAVIDAETGERVIKQEAILLIFGLDTPGHGHQRDDDRPAPAHPSVRLPRPDVTPGPLPPADAPLGETPKRTH